VNRWNDHHISRSHIRPVQPGCGKTIKTLLSEQKPKNARKMRQAHVYLLLGWAYSVEQGRTAKEKKIQ
jgi:hypothetical protein